MTSAIPATQLAGAIRARFPDAVTEVSGQDVFLRGDLVRDVCLFLRDDQQLAFDSLVFVTSVDYVDYFDVVYRLVSLRHNHGAVVKTRAYGREAPTLPSVTPVWEGANFQEREIFDLMGIRFEGHPNLKRIMLWEGFDGHPLRKDFVLQRP